MRQHSVTARKEAALRERIKELTCLYGLARIASQPERNLDDILGDIAALLPPAWQHPEVAVARLVLDGVSHATGAFPPGCPTQSADIVLRGTTRGRVEVGYTESKPTLHEGPFLTEERSLLNEVARQTAFIIDRQQAEEERAVLHGQIRHADRLATIGVLAAGIAHELNEPIGNILGFAQLAIKSAALPDAVRRDLEKIEKASLHARGIIQKLLIFARQVPPEKKCVDLNTVVEEGLYIINTRGVKEGVALVCDLGPDLPHVVADPLQLHQVLVNLVVNALQSLHGAGTVTIQTRFRDGAVWLIVEDTGPCMDPAVVDKIFVPFFTTKDVGQGTGLGLPVVHGIVTAHGGTIRVMSQIDRGTRFEIRLPVQEDLHPEELH